MYMPSKWIPWADALSRQRASAARRKRRAVLAASAALSAAAAAAAAGGVAAAAQPASATVSAARVAGAAASSCSPKVDFLTDGGWTNICGYGDIGMMVMEPIKEVRQAEGRLTRVWLHYGPGGKGALCIYSRKDYHVPPKDQDVRDMLVSLNHSPC
jgi:hypothetical protein